MRILVAGAGGAIGKQLLPALASAGHDATALPCEAALDRDAVVAAARTARPEAMVLQLAGAGPAELHRLCTEGVDNVLAAAWEVGVDRVVAARPAGGPAAAVRYLEEELLAARGVVLRLGPSLGVAAAARAIAAAVPGRYDVAPAPVIIHRMGTDRTWVAA